MWIYGGFFLGVRRSEGSKAEAVGNAGSQPGCALGEAASVNQSNGSSGTGSMVSTLVPGSTSVLIDREW